MPSLPYSNRQASTDNNLARIDRRTVIYDPGCEAVEL